MEQARTRKTEYITRSLSLLKERFTSLVKGIFAVIDGYSRKKDSWCYSSQSDFANEFGVSTKQVSRAIGYLEDNEMIERRYSSRAACCCYRSTKKGRRAHVVTPMFLYEREYTFKYEDRTFTRPLRRCEIDLFSLIASSEDGAFEATVRQFAKMLGFAVSTTQSAIDGLIHCDLIHRNEKEKSKSRLAKSTYHADSETVREIQKLVKTARERAKAKQAAIKAAQRPAETAPERVRLPESVLAANARADRERYYAQLRHKAEKAVESVKQRLEREPEYATSAQELRAMEIQQARAEVANDVETLRKIQRRRVECTALMKNVMRRLGYTSEDLTPKYRCSKCSDTGFDRNGKGCSCYPKGGGT